MTRIVVGNRDGAVALAQARAIVAGLSSEWPDINLVQKTITPPGGSSDSEALLSALERKQLSLAVIGMERLPLTLPEGLSLASVTRRSEPRSMLLAKGARGLGDLAAGTVVGVPTSRDAAVLRSVAPELAAAVLTAGPDESMRQQAAGEYGALLIPGGVFHDLDRREVQGAMLEADQFPPAPGQGSLGLVVREDDDAAFELAYTLQHRPSRDRITAERAFLGALAAAGYKGIMQVDSVPAAGALASVTGDGEMSLFGSVIHESGSSLMATTTGEASEAADLGQELAQDFLQQLGKLG